MIRRAPERRPALPQPAIARPKISASELGAAPQMALPISKTRRAIKKTHLMLKMV
jgi:hypothetical protein